MRRRAWAWLLMIVGLGGASGAGCPQVLHQYTAVAPPALPPAATLDDVVRRVNENSQKVTSVHSTDARISVPFSPPLSASLAVERPRRFRLKAETALLGPEIDLGSNDERFWFWIRRNEPPALFHARHDQRIGLGQGRAPLLEPEWLIDALGVPLLDPASIHGGLARSANGRLEIRSTSHGPAGPVERVTVVDGRTGWVIEQHIFDQRGERLASSRMSQHRRDPLTGATLPRRVELEWPARQFSLKIDLGDVQANYLGEQPERLWTMPEYAGYPAVDLATADMSQLGFSGGASGHVPPPEYPRAASGAKPSAGGPADWFKKLLPR